MSQEYKRHFKEVSPEETVEKLRAKLKELGVEVEEHWNEESYINTYSLRLTIKGTTVGTNGKGISKEYALASAYAEFFERYQNNLIGFSCNLRGKDYDFYEAPDEEVLAPEDIVKSNNSLIRLFIHNRNQETKSVKEKSKLFHELNKVDTMAYGLENKYVTIPYYSVKNNNIEYLPKSLVARYYGSNGMCAGNTAEEALVQGLAEVLERVVQKKLFIERPTLPDIPDEYIEKFPYVYERYMKLKECKQYYVTMKDCSFGGIYPVAALVVSEKNTGAYGIKLGCHPNYAIAMERTLTEATQGNDIFTYARRSTIDFSNTGTENLFNIYNSYKVGLGQYPYQIFGKDSTYKFAEFEDVSGLTNQDLLKVWTDKIINMGYDILIRDNTSLGLPTYQILVPGMSELIEDKDQLYRAYNTRFYVGNLLLHPRNIDRSNIKYVIATMNYFIGSTLENTMGSYVKYIKNFPCSDFGHDCNFFTAMCYIMNREFDKAASSLKFVIRAASTLNNSGTEGPFLHAIYHYCEAMAEMNNHKKVLEYLETFFSENICKRLDELFVNLDEVIIKLLAPYIGKENEEFQICEDVIRKLRTERVHNQPRQLNLRNLFHPISQVISFT